MKRALLVLAVAMVACGGDSSPSVTPDMATTADDSPVAAVPLSATLAAPGLSAPVDVARDQWGIPHIYGKTIPDVLYAEGYVMAQDRLVLMDLARRSADGTLAELYGGLAASIVDSDIAMRMHHLRATAEKDWASLAASTDPNDQVLVAGVKSFAAGINAYVADVVAGNQHLAAALAFLYDPTTFRPWDPVDSLVLGDLQAFDLAFDADSDITASQADTAEQMVFASSSDPAMKARVGIASDLHLLAPVDHTYSIVDSFSSPQKQGAWTGMGGDTSQARRMKRRLPSRKALANMMAVLAKARATVAGLGHDRLYDPDIGSNNWVVGPQLSSSGHAMVANDTHLALGNPATFYLVHLVASGTPGLDVMGAQFAGIPGVVLGMDGHVAWGATVNNIDVTDVYAEQVVDCQQGKCVMFKGQPVPLVPRTETIKVGRFGKITSTVNVTLYDVPQHGPIIPRVSGGKVDALGANELSVRYTGYDGGQLLRFALDIDRAASMQDAVAAIDRDFAYGGQNWVIADDQGHFGWTQRCRVPRRAPGHAPWKVLPGDGSAEWGPDMDPKYIPHAYDPQKGFIATANADPIGTTDDGDPFFDEPMVDGAPLYLGAWYDPGTRVGRITKRIDAAMQQGKKLSVDDLQAIQADAVSEWGQLLAPAMLDAAQALDEEHTTPGTHPELAPLVAAADAKTVALVAEAYAFGTHWTFDTPTGVVEDQPTPAQLGDALATVAFAAWLPRYVHGALDDELAKLGTPYDEDEVLKLVERMTNHPETLATGVSKATGDAVLFDDLATPGTVETKRFVAARALLDGLAYLRTQLGDDFTKWSWGALHTLTLQFAVPMDALAIPRAGDPQHPHGFPRHGFIGTVDVGDFGLSGTSFSYDHGPAIRFACEMAPDGPHARNALPGGETFDPDSPHYRDQMELWRKNETFDLAFTTDAVVTSATMENAVNGDGRVRFAPK